MFCPTARCLPSREAAIPHRTWLFCFSYTRVLACFPLVAPTAAPRADPSPAALPPASSPLSRTGPPSRQFTADPLVAGPSPAACEAGAGAQQEAQIAADPPSPRGRATNSSAWERVKAVTGRRRKHAAGQADGGSAEARAFAEDEQLLARADRPALQRVLDAGACDVGAVLAALASLAARHRRDCVLALRRRLLRLEHRARLNPFSGPTPGPPLLAVQAPAALSAGAPGVAHAQALMRKALLNSPPLWSGCVCVCVCPPEYSSWARVRVRVRRRSARRWTRWLLLWPRKCSHCTGHTCRVSRGRTRRGRPHIPTSTHLSTPASLARGFLLR